MRILMITQFFQPEPTMKGLPFAQELRRRGHEVEVLTGFPNYPGGKVYPGYRIRAWQCEEIDGIRVIRVPLYPSHNQSSIRRVLNYVSFAVAAAIVGVWSVRKADVAYVYHPPGTIGLPAAVIRACRGIPFVYDIQDLWPDTIAATGMLNNSLVLRMMAVWCRVVYRVASRITVLSKGFKRVLVSRGVPSDKIEVVYNWCDDSAISQEQPCSQLATELGLAGRFNVVFTGTMGLAQGLDTVLDAAKMLDGQDPTVQLVLVGGGVESERLKTRAVEMGLPNILFLPRRPQAEIGAILALADVLLVHLNDQPLFKITIPSKVQAYMAAGRPILCAVGGDANDLVAESGGGAVCQPQDPAALVDAILDLRAMPEDRLRILGENGRRFYESKLSLMNGVSRFEAIFQSVVATRSVRRKQALLHREHSFTHDSLAQRGATSPVIEAGVSERQSDAA